MSAASGPRMMPESLTGVSGQSYPYWPNGLLHLNFCAEYGTYYPVNLLVINWYFFLCLQITFRGHLMLTALDEGVLGAVQ